MREFIYRLESVSVTLLKYRNRIHSASSFFYLFHFDVNLQSFYLSSVPLNNQAKDAVLAFS